jgi:hypothetical protein
MRYRDFPEPLMMLKSGPLWCWEEIAEWMRQTGRL